jgi:hypothetical protein
MMCEFRRLFDLDIPSDCRKVENFGQTTRDGVLKREDDYELHQVRKLLNSCRV